MKNYAILENHLLPMPAAIFRAIFLDRLLRDFEVLGGNDQLEPLLAFLDSRFDTLAGENETPIHRLASRAGVNDGRGFHCYVLPDIKRASRSAISIACS